MADNQEYPAPQSKAELLDWIRQSHDDLEGTLALFRHEQVTEPMLEGDRSIKDLMAHITAWEQVTLSRLAVRTEPERLAEIARQWEDGGVDAFNDRLYMRDKDLPLPEVRLRYNESYDQFVAIVENMPEEDLLVGGRYPSIWDGEPLWILIGANSYDHYREHNEQLQRWLDEHKGQE